MIAETDILIRIISAALLGGLVGIEREISKEPAGIRTHMLVSVGSAAFTIMSITFSPTDTVRIAAGIVTGIGFLGAGAIFRDSEGVKGLTTAADLWCSAGIGMACGMAFFFLGGAVAALTLLILAIKRLIKRFKG